MESIIKEKFQEYMIYPCFKCLKSKRAFIAGGALTSALTNKKINDFDIYFRTEEECQEVIDFFTSSDNYKCVATTDNAVTFEFSIFTEKIIIQLIRAKHLINECIYDTISSFDFTINMAAYDLLSDNIIAHVDFYKDNMKRKLVFNENTLYPIISMHRAIKYMERGYKLSGYEQVKIALAINNLNMKNYKDLKIQLQGIDTSMFRKLTDKLMENPEEEYNYDNFKNEIKQTLKGD